MSESAAVRSPLDPLRQARVGVERWQGGAHEAAHDELAVEEPLEIRVRTLDGDGKLTHAVETIAVIMRTPGQDEELAAGFLYSEGLLSGRDELAGIEPGCDPDGLPTENVLDVLPAPGVDLAGRAHEAGYSRQFAVNASCGVCGTNSVAAACQALPPLQPDSVSVATTVLYSLPDRLHRGQRVFAHTGGLHAAALFQMDGTLQGLREDIGRHNAVDKLVGRALLDAALPLDTSVLLVSGRLSFEIVQKALAARIPVVAAISAPSSLAVDLAQAAGITLVAFLRGDHLNVYAHSGRLLP